MNKSAYVFVRIRPDVKAETDNILKSLGITATQAISMFYNQINMRRGLPFPVEIPNEVSRQAIQDAVNGVDMKVSHSMEEF
ncbi:MAG: type II toxin-antitoxin system RelB/DinJ family antitoxin [Chloroflexi bacterium]|nr:type II toxin-antitoxin system RelB/DinJ family antitoxin [Chloroflexota bacterium]